MLTLSKTEETMVTSEKRVSGQRQSPGKGWPQLEAGELGNSQEAGASGTEETRGKKRRQPYRKAGRQRAPLYMPASCQYPICPQAQGMKERRAGDRQQGKSTARLWDQGDTMLSP